MNSQESKNKELFESLLEKADATVEVQTAQNTHQRVGTQLHGGYGSQTIINIQTETNIDKVVACKTIVGKICKYYQESKQQESEKGIWKEFTTFAMDLIGKSRSIEAVQYWLTKLQRADFEDSMHNRCARILMDELRLLGKKQHGIEIDMSSYLDRRYTSKRLSEENYGEQEEDARSRKADRQMILDCLRDFAWKLKEEVRPVQPSWLNLEEQ